MGIKNINPNRIFTALAVLFCSSAFSQVFEEPELPVPERNTDHILVDGLYGDWQNQKVMPDEQGDAIGLDITAFGVSHTDQSLLLFFKFSEEVDLFDNNELELYIDADNSFMTGERVNNIGADLKIHFGNRRIYDLAKASEGTRLSALPLEALPTYTSKWFEAAIPLKFSMDGANIMLDGDIKVLLKDRSVENGDQYPNEGKIFHYRITEVAPPRLAKVQLEKSGHLRLMTYNTEHDGILDQERKTAFTKVVGAMQPDIIGFNELWNTTEEQTLNFLGKALPDQDWHVKKLDGNISCSRFPIINSWTVLEGSRILALLIEVPTEGGKVNVLFVNGHLSCCAKDHKREEQAKAFRQFIADRLAKGDISGKTPVIFSGDMNLVGKSSQYNIIRGGINGNPGNDVDGSDLFDLNPVQTYGHTSITWRDPQSSYPPGRLDYIFYSDSNIGSDRGFVLNTEHLPENQLKIYNLRSATTTLASDHLPIIADFSFKR